MDLKEFRQNCLKTEKEIPQEKLLDKRLMFGVLQMIGDLGDVLDQFKKNIVSDTPVNDSFCRDKLYGVRFGQVPLQEFEKGDRQFQPYEPTKLNTRVLHGMVGMISECCELASLLLEILSSDEFTDDQKLALVAECGDASYYMTATLDAMGISEEEMYDIVIAKLRSRHGDRFNAESAVQRNLEEEKEAMLGALKSKLK